MRRTDLTVDEREWLAERFEAERRRLRGVAYRMLGSVAEADDAVQEAWLRLGRSDASGIENLGGWLTTVVARVCLSMLRKRKARREQPLGPQLPELIVTRDDQLDPEQEALLADSLGLALLVVLEELGPAERLAFVLHDMFAVSFEEIASILGRSPDAARQLASRARRRVRGAPVPDADLSKQREVVDAFTAASRDGDFDALFAVLDPDVVIRADRDVPAGAPTEFHGAEAVAERVMLYSALAPWAHPALVNGTPGFVVAPQGQPFSVVAFTITGGKIVEIDVFADPERIRQLDLDAVLTAPDRASP
jgi:RNA polymerase sigma factor (sigma-70 family)